MIGARQIVERAVEALIAGDIAQHLSNVAPNVIAQMNENPPVRRIAEYENELRLLLTTEIVHSYQVVGVTTSGDAVTVDLVQEQSVPTSGISEVVQSSYVVRGMQIVQVHFTALAGPNRRFHFP